MNAVRLTSSPEPSRGLFLNRHASRSYVCVETRAEKPEKPHSRSGRGRLYETGSSYGEVTSLQVDLPQSRGLGHMQIAPERDDERTRLGAIAELCNIQFLF